MKKLNLVKAGALAGLLGGLAEVFVMGTYAAIAGSSGAGILSLVTVSFFSEAISFGLYGPAIGLVIHLLLSLIIGVAFALGISRLAAAGSAIGYSRAIVYGTALLLTIWAVNFFVVLPVLNPLFVVVAPLKVTLLSKLTFGISLAALPKLLAAVQARDEAKVALEGV